MTTKSVEEAAKLGVERIETAAQNGEIEALIEEYPQCEETIRMFAPNEV